MSIIFNEEMDNLLSKIRQKLLEVKNELPLGQTVYKDMNFVLCHETDEENYLQCFKEINSLFRGIDEANFLAEEHIINKDEAEYKLKTEDNVFEIRRLEVKIKRMNHNVLMEKSSIYDSCERIYAYYTRALEYEKKMGEKLTRKKYNASQQTEWLKRLEREINLQLESNKTGIQADFIKAVRNTGNMIALSKNENGLTAQVMSPEKFKELTENIDNGENNG